MATLKHYGIVWLRSMGYFAQKVKKIFIMQNNEKNCGTISLFMRFFPLAGWIFCMIFSKKCKKAVLETAICWRFFVKNFIYFPGHICYKGFQFLWKLFFHTKHNENVPFLLIKRNNGWRLKIYENLFDTFRTTKKVVLFIRSTFCLAIICYFQ